MAFNDRSDPLAPYRAAAELGREHTAAVVARETLETLQRMERQESLKQTLAYLQARAQVPPPQANEQAAQAPAPAEATELNPAVASSGNQIILDTTDVAILETMKNGWALTQLEIANKSGISKRTVQDRLQSLMSDGLIQQHPKGYTLTDVGAERLKTLLPPAPPPNKPRP